MRPFVPARSAYTTWTGNQSPSSPAAARILMGNATRARLRSVIIACTDNDPDSWVDHSFQFRDASGGGGNKLFEVYANRMFDATYPGEARWPMSIDLPGKGILFDSGIYLYTVSTGDAAVQGYTITVIYT